MKNNIIKNASWIVVCKIVQSVLSLIIGMITARYLGPSNYGVLNYVSSVVAFAVPIMQLGLNNTIIREFIKYPNRENEILGTALIINVLSSILCMIGSVSFIAIANSGHSETLLVGTIYSLTILFQATEMTQYWFQAKLLSKYPSIASLVAYIIVAAYKIYLLATNKGIIFFAVSYILDFFLISAILLVLYRVISKQRLSVNFSIGREMLSRSKYYIIPSLMVMVFQHTDKVMLNLMIDEAETGFYSAAITIIGISGFVFSAIIDSARPTILEEKEKDHRVYEKRMVQLYSLITYLSLAQSVFMTLLARPLVIIIYGEAYAKTINILRIAVWYITFSYYGSVRNIWILSEEKQKYLTGINITGGIANIFLNFVLIPVWGAIGAAVASLITQFFTNVIIGFVFKPIRPNNYLMIKGLNPVILIGMIKSVLLSRIKKHKKTS